VHDGVLGTTQEVGGTTETVKHTGAIDTSAVGVGVDVDLNRCVHTNDTETANDFRRVRDLLRAEEKLRVVLLPVVVEALETAWGESDGCSSREVQVSRVEEVKERILEDFGPDLEVLEVGSSTSETTNDGVGNVANTGLEWEQVRWKAALGNLVLEELNQVSGDLLAVLIRRRVVLCLVGVVGLNHSYDTLWIDWNVRSTDAVFWRHDQVWFPSRWEVGHCDIVKTSEIGRGGVDFDDDLVGHLADFWRCSDTCAANDTTVLCDGTSLLGSATVLHTVNLCCAHLNYSNVNLVLGPLFLVLGIESVHQVHRKHAQMFVEELDVSVVDTLCDLLSDLMRSSALDHVQLGPSVLGLCAR